MDSNQQPVVSVVMPVYNCEAYIHDAVESVLSQTFSDFELLIIDDCSTDRTLEVISQFNDPRIYVFHKSVNSGITDSLNLGIEKARGRYIARMDGDDVCEPHRFQVQVDYMEAHPEVGLTGSWYRIIGTNEPVPAPQKHSDIKLAMLEYCPIAHPTVFLRKQVLETFSLRYDKSYEMAEDYELWSRLLLHSEVYIIPEFLLRYRRHVNQSSARSADLQQALSGKIRCTMLRQLVANFNLDLRMEQLVKFLTSATMSFQATVSLLRQIKHLSDENQLKQHYTPSEFDEWLQAKQRLLVQYFFGQYNGVKRIFNKFRLLIFFLSDSNVILLSNRELLKLFLFK